MSLLALKLAVLGVLIGLAVSLCFHQRRMFLAQTGSMPAKDLRVMFASLLFMAVAALLGLWAALDWTPPEWQKVVYTFLPLLVLACYGFELFLITRLRAQWKQSFLFRIAAFLPVVGCVLVMLISWREQRISR